MTVQDIVRRFYPTMSTREIAAVHGVSPNAVAYWARKLRVSHTPDTLLRLRRKSAANAALALTPEARRKRSERMRRVWAVERFRALSGMPPKTRLAPSLVPSRVRGAIYRLRTRHDYFTDTSVASPYTLFYDTLTRRSPRERLLAARYGLRFLPAGEEDGPQDAANPQPTDTV